ncbi:MAG: hypothetical protein HDR88_13655 [Bacteroides sp.]|nr:hypothetical protein [Bacteroides sp.]
MKVLKFKCTLLSEVILNRNSATSGPNETLDFIPGSNFLGIVAGKLYPRDSDNGKMDEAMTIFHSGKVRFGDAHPSIGDFRGLKVPASMFYPKLSKPEEELYIHHLIPAEADMGKKQLKQCRNGFYDFSVSAATEGSTASPAAKLIKTATNFAIKSAYDRSSRRSKDEQLFSYQSLRSGVVMYFSVEIDDSEMSPQESNELAEKIKNALTGVKRIGRSRTAQYGLVEIEEADYKEVESGQPVKTGKDKIVTVYADSRLIFLDKYGMPTFQPTADQLGLKGEIMWDKSQIRTFRYAPWNFKRQSFDTDRCGIEKGSVIVVKIPDNCSPALNSRYLGSYINEGFGRVVYNPSFLNADKEGVATYRLSHEDSGVKSGNKPTVVKSSPSTSSILITYLRQQKVNESAEVFEKVNDWIKNNLNRFNRDKFSSQWGNIRNMAISAPDYEILKILLFDGKDGYLTHGIAKEKWAENGRLEYFKKFVEGLKPTQAKHIIVNLASEMAKKCKD